MTVREQLLLLSQLGLKDLQLKELREKLGSVPKKANEVKSKASDASIRAETLKTQNTQTELRKKLLDLEIQTEKGNLRKWEARADKIKGEREYTTLLSEIGSQKKAISNLETQMLEIYEAQDKIKKNLDAAQKSLDEANTEFQTEWSKVEGDLQVLESELALLEQSRSELLAAIPVALARRYQQIADRRAGVAIAFLAKEVCGGCKRTVTPELCNRILKGEILESCPACQRLLVVENA